VQLDNTEATLKDNGMTLNPIAVVELDESQTTISEHPTWETIDDVLALMKWHTEGQLKVAITSIQPPQPKDKIHIPSSPCKKPATKIILPRTPAGV
jgi:hypothetical protein